MAVVKKLLHYVILKACCVVTQGSLKVKLFKIIFPWKILYK